MNGSAVWKFSHSQAKITPFQLPLFFILLKRDGASRPFLLYKEIGLQKYRSPVFSKGAYRTFRVGFYTDEVRHRLVSSVFYLFPEKIKGGQNELVKSPKMIAMTALIRVISF